MNMNDANFAIGAILEGSLDDAPHQFLMSRRKKEPIAAMPCGLRVSLVDDTAPIDPRGAGMVEHTAHFYPVSGKRGCGFALFDSITLLPRASEFQFLDRLDEDSQIALDVGAFICERYTLPKFFAAVNSVAFLHQLSFAPGTALTRGEQRAALRDMLRYAGEQRGIGVVFIRVDMFLDLTDLVWLKATFPASRVMGEFYVWTEAHGGVLDDEQLKGLGYVRGPIEYFYRQAFFETAPRPFARM
jgi:hypothetical protein